MRTTGWFRYRRKRSRALQVKAALSARGAGQRSGRNRAPRYRSSSVETGVVQVEMFGVDDPRMEEAIALRLAVFVDEQGIPLDEEIDAHDRDDAAAVHAIVRDSQKIVIATGRFYPRNQQTAQIGRMAVALAVRGT